MGDHPPLLGAFSARAWKTKSVVMLNRLNRELNTFH
jgi:hypothetical protein